MKFLKKMILTLVILIATLSIGTYIFMQGKQFGKAPSGKRLERILKSPHYKDGKFQNLNPTPQLAEDTSMPKVLFNFFFSKVEILPFSVTLSITIFFCWLLQAQPTKKGFPLPSWLKFTGSFSFHSSKLPLQNFLRKFCHPILLRSSQ